jgi:WD40 repeat protein
MKLCRLLASIALALVIFEAAPVGAQVKDKTLPKDGVDESLPDGALQRIGTVRLRHLGRVLHVQFSADGKRVMSVDPKMFSLWDRKSGAAVRRVPLGPQSGRNSGQLNEAEMLVQLMATGRTGPPGALSADGGLLAVPSAGKVRIYDLSAGKGPRDLAFKDECYSSVALSADGKWLARCTMTLRDGDPQLSIVETASGKTVQQLRLPGGTAMGTLCFSGDGKLLAGAPGNSRSIYLWSLDKGKRIRCYEASDYVVNFSFLPRSQKLVSATPEALYFWDLASDEETAKIPLPDPDAAAMAFAPDGLALATAGNNKDILLWDIEKAAIRSRIDNLPAHVSALAYSADGKQLLAGTADGTVHLLDIDQRRDITPVQHRSKLTPIAFLNPRILLAKGGNDGLLQHIDTATGKVLKEYDSSTNPMAEVVVSPDGRLSAQIDFEDNDIRLWEIEKPDKEWRLKGHSGNIQAMVYSADSLCLASFANDNVLRIWNTRTGKQVKSMEMPIVPNDGRVRVQFRRAIDLLELPSMTHIAFAPDNRFIVFLDNGNSLSLWELATGKERGRLHLGQAAIVTLAFSADSRYLATIGRDDVVRVWDLLRLKFVQGFVPGEHSLHAVAFDASGRHLAVGTSDGEVILYDLVQGKERRRFQGHNGVVNKVLFAPRGDLLLSGGEDGNMMTWDIHAPAKAKAAAAPLEQAALTALWDKLGSADPAEAQKAAQGLHSQPAIAVTFLQKKLTPTPKAPAERIDKLIADLNLPTFTERELAQQALQQYDAQPKPALEAALEKKPPVEMARRIKILLDRIEDHATTPENLRLLRGVEVLEGIGTPESMAHLESLAKGAPHARLTTFAEAALQRRQKNR